MHNQAVEYSELVVVPGARHIDVFDRVDVLPFDRLARFFSETLAWMRLHPIRPPNDETGIDSPSIPVQTSAEGRERMA